MGIIIKIARGANLSQIQASLVDLGCWPGSVHISTSGDRVLAIKPWSVPVAAPEVERIPGVESVLVAVSNHPRVDAQILPLAVAGVSFGGSTPVVMAGPCAVENEDQIHVIAERVAAAGARFLRGGAYKPRTSPYSFQGHGVPGLQWLRAAASANGLRTVTELLTPSDAEIVAVYADLIQIGSRNMQNTPVLRAAGQTGKPALLKRGIAATLDEWLLAAETVLLSGAPNVLLCERGVRGFDPTTRNLLDLGAVADLSARGFPVIVDPSHATGRRDLVVSLSHAALAAGACGLLIETHDHPAAALSDGPQALTPQQFSQMMRSLKAESRPSSEYSERTTVLGGIQ